MSAHLHSYTSGQRRQILALPGVLAVVLGGLLAGSSAQAQEAVGDFGFVLPSSGISAGVTPPDLGQQLLLTTENSNPSHDGGTVFADAVNGDGSTGAVPISVLAGVIGADPASIVYNANGPGTEGSGYSFVVNAAGPSVLSVNADFVTSEPIGAPGVNPDFAFYNIAQVVGGFLVSPQFGLLGSAADDSSNFQVISDPHGTSPFDFQEGYQTATFAIPAAGSYLFGFGVADANTFQTQSGLFLDNIQLTAVPEPSSGVLLLLPAAAAAYVAMRRRNKLVRQMG